MSWHAVMLAMSGLLHGLGLVAWLLPAKHTPIDIGAQVFAAHSAACRAFDRGAELGGDRSGAFDQLADELRRLVEVSGQLGCRAAGLAGSFDGVLFHGAILKRRFTLSQALIVAWAHYL